MPAYKPRIKCFGGVLHGQFVKEPQDSNRIDAMDNRATRRRVVWPPESVYDIAEQRIKCVSYTIETLRDVRRSPFSSKRVIGGRYAVERSLRVAVIDGKDNLLKHELFDLQDAMLDIPWEWNQVPSIMDLDDWWSWQQWKRGGLRRGWYRRALQSGPWWEHTR